MWFPVDVEETAEQYTFVADVPGLGKNDIKVRLQLVLVVRPVSMLNLLYCCKQTAGPRPHIAKQPIHLIYDVPAELFHELPGASEQGS